MESSCPIFNLPFANSTTTSTPPNTWTTRPPNPNTLSSTAGRKRSRDAAAENLEDDDYYPKTQSTPLPTPIEDEDEWEYGPGMTLIKPNKNYIMSAESQSGTWVEESTEPKQSPTPAPSPERPTLRPHKSQRLHLTTIPDIADSFSLKSGCLMTPLSSTACNGLKPNSGPVEPTVDDFTRHLGIGWSSIDTNSDLQAAARGWTKFIENHFPVTEPKIRLQSRGLASFLVEANEGYFLFGEDLKQGRLVSQSLEKTWENLRANPPLFDSDAVMEAGETPKVMHSGFSMTTAMQQEAGNWNHVPHSAPQSLEVEMDMS